MNRKRTTPPSLNIGIASLVVILIVLCFTTFAMLTLQTAENEMNNNHRLGEHKQDYYQASNLSEDILHSIADQGYNHAEPAAVEKQLPALAGNYNLDADDIDIIISDSDARWAVPVGSNQKLNVEVKLQGNSYEVTRWQVTK